MEGPRKASLWGVRSIITTTALPAEQAYQVDERCLTAKLQANTLAGPVVTPMPMAFTINKRTASHFHHISLSLLNFPFTFSCLCTTLAPITPASTKIYALTFSSLTTRITRLFLAVVTVISLAGQSSFPLVQHSAFILIIFCPFLAETFLLSCFPNSSTLRGAFKSAEPWVKMFHHVTHTHTDQQRNWKRADSSSETTVLPKLIKSL